MQKHNAKSKGHKNLADTSLVMHHHLLVSLTDIRIAAAARIQIAICTLKSKPNRRGA
jgi:hypothetical protein